MKKTKINFLGIKSRILIRKVDSYYRILFFKERGQWIHTISSEVKTTDNLNETRTSWG